MKQPFYKSPPAKWGMFAMLLGSLGFSLSMNPQHFNNIARFQVEDGLYHVELAAEEAPATSAVREVTVRRVEKRVSLNNETYLVTAQEETDGAVVKTQATFERIQSTVAVGVVLPCNVCGTHALGASISDTEKLNAELLKIVEDGQKKTTTETAAEVVAPAKAGEALEVDLAKWAEKCDSSDDKLDCHKDRLVELAKYLKNSKETSGKVLDYYKSHVRSDLMAMLRSPRYLRVISGQSYMSNVEMSDLGKDIMSELNDALGDRANGGSVVKDLARLYSATVAEDARQLINVGNEAKAANNHELVNRITAPCMVNVQLLLSNPQLCSMNLDGTRQRANASHDLQMMELQAQLADAEPSERLKIIHQITELSNQYAPVNTMMEELMKSSDRLSVQVPDLLAMAMGVPSLETDASGAIVYSGRLARSGARRGTGERPFWLTGGTLPGTSIPQNGTNPIVQPGFNTQPGFQQQQQGNTQIPGSRSSNSGPGRRW